MTRTGKIHARRDRVRPETWVAFGLIVYCAAFGTLMWLIGGMPTISYSIGIGIAIGYMVAETRDH